MRNMKISSKLKKGFTITVIIHRKMKFKSKVQIPLFCKINQLMNVKNHNVFLTTLMKMNLMGLNSIICSNSVKLNLFQIPIVITLPLKRPILIMNNFIKILN